MATPANICIDLFKTEAKFMDWNGLTACSSLPMKDASLCETQEDQNRETEIPGVQVKRIQMMSCTSSSPTFEQPNQHAEQSIFLWRLRLFWAKQRRREMQKIVE